jgi:hypothetical protein
MAAAVARWYAVLCLRGLWPGKENDAGDGFILASSALSYIKRTTPALEAKGDRYVGVRH